MGCWLEVSRRMTDEGLGRRVVNGWSWLVSVRFPLLIGTYGLHVVSFLRSIPLKRRKSVAF